MTKQYSQKIMMLSLWQPWASLCVWKNPDDGKAEKQIETRHWSTEYRGLIAIHATKTLNANSRWAIQNNTYIQEALTHHKAVDFGSVKRVTLTVGSIIGVVELIDVREMELTNSWASDRDLQFGIYMPGRFGWIFNNPVEFKNPIECRGLQNLGSPKPEIEVRIFEELARSQTNAKS